jgi:hypothetical protein
MGKWRTVFLAVALLAVLAVIIRLSVPDREPQYQGRSLSNWLLVDREKEPYEEAIRHIGTNSLPYLLKWMAYDRPNWRDEVVNLTPAMLQKLVRPITQTRADALADASADAFQYLGTNGLTAVPDLVTLMRNTNAPVIAFRAMRALSSLGTNALGPVIAAAQDQHNPIRFMAIMAIAFMPSGPACEEITTPVLIGLLSDTTEPHIAPIAARGLGRNTNTAAMSTPPLMNCLTSPLASAPLRAEAAQALSDLGAQATNALPALSNALTDPSPTVRAGAKSAILTIHGESARPVSPP